MDAPTATTPPPERPTPDDMSRDLGRDLADIMKYAQHQQTAIIWEDRTNYAYPELARWRNHLHEVAEAAIRRALYAEHLLRCLHGSCDLSDIMEETRSYLEALDHEATP